MRSFFYALRLGLSRSRELRQNRSGRKQTPGDTGMFHFDGGLKITSIDLAVDVRRRQPRGFISHAHTDHMGRHELAYCTPATAALYQKRYGARPTRLMPFGEPLDVGRT